jgi:hypothetical protein
MVVLCAVLLNTANQFADQRLGRDWPLAVLALTAAVSAVLVLAGEWGRPRERFSPRRRPAHCRSFVARYGTATTGDTPAAA